MTTPTASLAERTTSSPCDGSTESLPSSCKRDDAPRRVTEVVHLRDGLLAAVAALLEVHRGAQPVELVRQRALIDLVRPAGAPCRDAQGIGGDEAGECEAARGGGIRDPLLLSARDDRLGPVAFGARVRLRRRIRVSTGCHTWPRIDPDQRQTSGLCRGETVDRGARAADDRELLARVAGVHPKPEAHLAQPREQTLGVAAIGDEPGRLAVVEDGCRMLDVSVRVEDQKLGALTRREARERLRRERIEPRQPIFTGHGEHRAIAQGRDRSPGGECALLSERVAEVPETRLVGDGARNPCERSRHQSTLARRAEACDESSRPSAAMSQAHSR